MSTTIFPTPLNDRGTILAAPYTSGDGTMNVLSDVFGSPSASAPVWLTATSSGVHKSIFVCTGSTGTTLTISGVVQGESDVDLPAGTLLESLHSAQHQSLVHDSINALESAIDSKAADSDVVHLSGSETIAGVKTFSSTIVGSVSGNAANVTGTVAIANGGTGQTSANAAINALLPSQVSASGKFLTSNGTNSGWSSITGVGTAGNIQYINNTGFLDGAGLLNYATSGTILTTQAGAASDKSMVVKAASGQTANILEVQDSNGSPLYIVNASGDASVLPFSFGGTGTPTTGTDLCPWLYVNYQAKCIRASLSCKTAPSGGSFVVEIKRSADGGSTFPDTICTVTLTTGSKLVTTTTFTNQTLNAGDYLRLDITSVNNAANWTLRLSTLSRNV